MKVSFASLGVCFVHFDGATGRIVQFSSAAFKIDELECAEIIDPPDEIESDALAALSVDLASVERGYCKLKKMDA